ncbi:hypothetical protein PAPPERLAPAPP_00300 [Brevundimonas phage vB_BpoS-Papperlapapp]|uniref:NadR/Ttd14 AAA domain-containing protein n=2 Tax=Marchewkavirus TaxID=3425052 RepID=A0A9E7MQ49_9CAUD|nr:hypothetical protein KABACHOK_04500 [Brevundimonas phage vB_BpoS-Kabachok]USN14957.1 hypothetical protein DOMOVOI_05070 [Brevundimonas phage vB_BpoS-Domovoi]USN15772.1 hypothetical protein PAPPERLAPAPP_00300 [Brevundimonas phage vB_BpoS-Papperlapapp]
MTTRVLNFWSGPCGGKSTVKAGTFFHLKIGGYRAAQVEEYATERSVSQDWATLADQRRVTWKQASRLKRFLGHVDWILTDSPLLLGCVYGQGDYAQPEFHQEVFDLFDSYENVNVWLDRPASAYQTYGRHHNEAEALEVDQKLLALLGDRIDFRTTADESTPQRVVKFIQERYK